MWSERLPSPRSGMPPGSGTALGNGTSTSLYPGREDLVTLAVGRYGEHRQSSRAGRRHIQSSEPTCVLREQGSLNGGRFVGVLVDPAPAHQLQLDRAAGNDLEVVFMSGGVQVRRPAGKRPPERGDEPLI